MMVWAVLASLLISCHRDFSSAPLEYGLDDIRCCEYEIRILPYNDLPYAWWVPAAFDDYPRDEDGVILFELDGIFYYHPTQIAQKMLHFLASYVRTGDSTYLDLTETFARTMLRRSVEKSGARFFPLPFDWPLGGCGLILTAPWVSGMSQGQMLSALIRLYAHTQNEDYLEASRQIMRSFQLLQPHHEPWVVAVDGDRYYWIEEYPEEDPNHVLNGFVFALFGIYDQYRITGDAPALRLLRAGITTISDHLHEWRQKGGPSKYCLKYGMAHPSYHAVHVDILKKLVKITRDPYIEEMLHAYESDFQYTPP